MKEATSEKRIRWEDDINMDLQELGCGVWSGSSWLRIETGGGACECGNEPSGSIKWRESLD
jgi:hypothetical protein